jgi:hypothetical protein
VPHAKSHAQTHEGEDQDGDGDFAPEGDSALLGSRLIGLLVRLLALMVGLLALLIRLPAGRLVLLLARLLIGLLVWLPLLWAASPSLLVDGVARRGRHRHRLVYPARTLTLGDDPRLVVRRGLPRLGGGT